MWQRLGSWKKKTLDLSLSPSPPSFLRRWHQRVSRIGHIFKDVLSSFRAEKAACRPSVLDRDCKWTVAAFHSCIPNKHLCLFLVCVCLCFIHLWDNRAEPCHKDNSLAWLMTIWVHKKIQNLNTNLLLLRLLFFSVIYNLILIQDRCELESTGNTDNITVWHFTAKSCGKTSFWGYLSVIIRR